MSQESQRAGSPPPRSAVEPVRARPRSVAPPDLHDEWTGAECADVAALRAEVAQLRGWIRNAEVALALNGTREQVIADARAALRGEVEYK